MRIGRNLLAGLANSIWAALVGLAVVPLYLRYLGLEAYGLVGFFATAQAMLLLLDLGLAPTVNREVARASAAGVMQEARRLLHTLAQVYWGTAALLALLVIALSSMVASHWLQASGLQPETLTNAVRLMGVVIACRWPVAVYQGALMGMESMGLASVISMAMVTLGSLGAVAILAFVSPTIEAFFLWQAGVALVHVGVMRRAAWTVVGRDEQTGFDAGALRKVWRFSAGMSGVAVASILLTQLDKLLLSRMLNLQDFGRYTLAGVVAGALAIFTVPAFNVIYPRYTALITRGDLEGLEQSYLHGTQVFCAVVFPVALMMSGFAQDLLHLWTGDAALAASVAPIAALLVLGTALNGAMHFPYALQLAAGVVSLPLILSGGLAVLVIPMVVVLTSAYGARGGAGAWLLVNLVYLFAGAWMTHRRLLVGLAPKWLLQCVLLPLAISLAAMLLGRYWIDAQPGWNSVARLAAATAVLVLSILILAALSWRSLPPIGKWTSKKIPLNN